MDNNLEPMNTKFPVDQTLYQTGKVITIWKHTKGEVEDDKVIVAA